MTTYRHVDKPTYRQGYLYLCRSERSKKNVRHAAYRFDMTYCIVQSDDVIPELLPSHIVCDRLSIDRGTLSRWVATGKIEPAIKLPGKRGAFLFHEDEVSRLEAAA